MFDIGFSEILVIGAIALVVMGPERLPQALRTLALWFGRVRRLFRSVRDDLENEIGIDDVRRQLHNENIMRNLEDAKSGIEDSINSIESTANNNAAPSGTSSSDNPETPSSANNEKDDAQK